VVSGILLVGPLNSNPTWSNLVAHRDRGSPMLAPVVDGGRSVRVWPGPEMPGFDRTRDPWPMPPSGPRTLYLQHPSDPVVWWSPRLLWSRPDWAGERTAVSRTPPLRWRPISSASRAIPAMKIISGTSSTALSACVRNRTGTS
jgi:uncharacterized membrane protein